MGETKFNVGRVLTRPEYSELMAWAKMPNSNRHRHSDSRSDGLVFCGYGYGYVNGEYWATPDMLEKRKAYSAQKVRQLRKTPEYREYHRAYCRKRYAENHLVREKMKARGQKHVGTPEGRVKARARAIDYARRNKAKVHALVKIRSLKKKSQLHPDHDKSIEVAMRNRCIELKQATGVRHDVDHIIPIAHGGWHHHDNLQVLPFDENQRKKANPFYISTKYKDFRSVPRNLWPEHLTDTYLAIMTT